MRQIVLDTETTGLSPQEGHRIIEIGCVELVNRRFTGNTLHLYLNPDREIDPGAAHVHGITTEFLADKPRFADIETQLMDFLADAELIIHNAAFDVGFLNHELTHFSREKWQPLDHYCRILDTLAIARQKHPGQRNSLDALCKRYGVNNTHRVLHGALLDADILSHVYLLMTGGQKTLRFDPPESSEHADTLAAKGAASPHQSRQRRLRHIKADEKAMTAHRHYLDTLTKTAGKPINWD